MTNRVAHSHRDRPQPRAHAKGNPRLPQHVAAHRRARRAPAAAPRRCSPPIQSFTPKGSWATTNADSYAHELGGEAYVHRGAEGLRELYARMFANGGGIL